MIARKPLTPALLRKLVALGLSDRKIAVRLGIARDSVTKARKAAGIPSALEQGLIKMGCPKGSVRPSRSLAWSQSGRTGASADTERRFAAAIAGASFQDATPEPSAGRLPRVATHVPGASSAEWAAR